MIKLSKFAENLTDLIFDNGLKQNELAKAVGLDNASVNRYLKGNCAPTVKAVVALADFFNCSVDFLLGLTEETSTAKYLPCPPVSERINYYYKLSGLTGYKLCKNTNLPDSKFYLWLSGTHSPTIYSVEKLANYFKCSLDEFLGRVK